MIRDIDSSCCADNNHRPRKERSKPTRAKIRTAVQEAYDHLWYVRHVELGRPAVGETAAQEIETKYGRASLDICAECQLRIEGRLGALRWVYYGSPVDCYDT